MPIHALPPQATHYERKVDEQQASNIDVYLHLLNKYPKLMRTGKLNDHTAGTYEIEYDPDKIKQTEDATQKFCYGRFLKQGFSETVASQKAFESSRVGVVTEDLFWMWIRDAVTAPSGVKHTYNRIVQKSDLNNVGGVAALPVIKDKNGNEKIVLNLNYRHATGSWEFELPRGLSNPNELPEDTAKREVEEETGCVIDQLVSLGNMTPDSGMAASIIPVYFGRVIAENQTAIEATEAIKGKYLLSLDEIKEGFKKGFIEVELNGEMTQVPIRDPFLTFALFQAENHKLFSTSEKIQKVSKDIFSTTPTTAAFIFGSGAVVAGLAAYFIKKD